MNELAAQVRAHVRPLRLGVPPTIYVYAYFDSAGRPLYVGQSFDLRTRHSAHSRRSAWFPDAREFRVLGTETQRSAAHRAEAAAVRKLRPAHNVIYNRAA